MLNHELMKHNQKKLQIILFIGSLIISELIYCQNEISYSLADYRGVPLDEKIVRLMNVKNGFFIEVGAHDGLFQSNTKRLEQYYNWTGILIEPSESLFKQLCTNRPQSKCFQCALGSLEENETYAYGDFDENGMSSINGTRLNRPATKKILIRSLQAILDELHIKHVHFFSLDTEGYELNILKGVDFTKTTFDYLLIEIYTNQYSEIISWLSDKGYEMIDAFSNYNKITNPGWDGTHNDYLFAKRK